MMLVENKKEELTVFALSISFILLYGSGFVGAKLGFPYAKPLTFLVLRFGITTLLLLMIAFFAKAKWPKSLVETAHIAISGVFLVCLFSIGTWVSMDMGVPPAISSLIIALQPITVAIASFFLLNKALSQKQWCGLLLGLVGTILVLGSNVSFSKTYVAGILMSFLGLLGLTVGNLYQKRFCSSMNIFTGGVIQSAISGIICLILGYFFEPFTVHWSGQFIFSLFWMCVVVSLGAISFLYVLLRKGESHKVASLFYLIPVVTAIISYFVFNTALGNIQIIGMLLAITGVGLVNFKFNIFKKFQQVRIQ